METNFIICYSGFHENGTETPKRYIILNISGRIDMDIIYDEIEKEDDKAVRNNRILSPFRSNRTIIIHSIQTF